MTAETRTVAVLAAVALLVVLLVAGTISAPRLPGVLGPLGRSGPEPGDFSVAEIERGAGLRRRLRPVTYVRLVLTSLLAVLLGATPAGARVVETAGRPLGGWFWQATLGAVALLGLGWLVGLPLDVRTERVLRGAGLSVQTWSSWALDRVKGLALAGVVLGLLAGGAYGLVRAAPDGWPFLAAGTAAVLTVVFSFVFPVLIEPVFARFRPLEAGAFRDELLELAHRDAVRVTDVLVADASRRTTALNAYVSGLGRTRRIVVYDTLLTTASPAETRLVVAHELGHAAERDVVRGTILGAAAAALGMLVIALCISSPRLLDLADAAGPSDPRTLGLAMLAVTVLGLVSGPLSNVVSRRVEARADLHSLELTRDVNAFVASERRLALTNQADLAPSRLAYLLFASHPSVPERIALARRWAEHQRLPVPGPLASRDTEAGAPLPAGDTA